jgi:hypothetical protein
VDGDIFELTEGRFGGVRNRDNSLSRHGDLRLRRQSG